MNQSNIASATFDIQGLQTIVDTTATSAMIDNILTPREYSYSLHDVKAGFAISSSSNSCE